MKKLLLILSLFLLGCKDKIIMEKDDTMIVTAIYYYNNSCVYTIKKDHFSIIELYDTCHKYQVGDTIKFITK